MAAFVPIPSVVEFNAIWLLDNQPAENTFHYHLGGGITAPVLQAMANSYFAWATANTVLWPTNVALEKLYLRDLTLQNGLVLEITPTANTVGTKAGNTLPNNVTFSVKRQTGLAGRANRGRIFWIGITDSDRSDDNHIAVARANAFVTGLNTLMNSQNTANSAQEVIAHKKLGTFTPIVGYTYSDLTLDAMRRRLPDHNRHR